MKSKLLRNALGLAIAMTLGLPAAKAATVTWDLTVDGDWDTITANWAGPNLYADGDTAIFNKDDGGVITLTGAVAPLATNVSAASGTYTFTGAGITAGTLTKSGAGTLVLENANTYTGATTISAGTLEIGGAGTLGSGGIYAGAISNAGTLLVSTSTNQTLSGVLSGTGVLTKTGAATLTLSGVNTFSGTTNVNQGTLKLDFTSRGSGAQQFTLGTVAVNSTLELFNNTPVAGNNYNTASSLPINTTFTGSGTITKTGVGIVDFFTGANLSGFSGLIDVQAGLLGDQSNSFTTGSASLNVASGAYFDLRTTNVSVNNLTGLGTVASSWNNPATKTLTVGALGGTSTFDGVIQNSVPAASGGTAGGFIALTKAGAGTLTLTKANTYTGATTINGGTLVLTGANGALGNTAITIGTDGTLKFDNTGAANNGNRLGTSAITLAGGTLQFANDAAAATNFSETVGAITANLASTITTSQAGVGQTSTFTLGGLAGLTNFSGPGLGVDGRNKITITGKANGAILGFINTTGLAVYDTTLGVTEATYTDVPFGGTISDGAATDIRLTGGTSGNVLLGSTTTTINTILQNQTSATVIDHASQTLRLGAASGILLPTGMASLTVGTAANSGTLTAGGAVLNGAGTLTLANNSGTSLLTVNSAIANNGSGAINVVTDGAGKVVLAGTNLYTGTTAIRAGTLELSGAGTLGTAGSYAGAIANTGTLLVSTSANQTFSGAVTGAGALIKDGAGALTLTNAGSVYTGATTVNNGILELKDLGGTITVPSFVSTTTVNANGTLRLNRSVAGFANRRVVGGNALILNGGTLSIDNLAGDLATGGWTTVSGAGALTGAGTININTGVFSRDNTTANNINTTATVNVASGAFFGAGRGGNSTIGALNGAGTVSTLWTTTNAGSITLGNGDDNGTFSGQIRGSGVGTDALDGGIMSVIKIGTGTQIFSGASTYTGATTVRNGVLTLAGGDNRLSASTALTIGDASTTGKLVLGSTGIVDITDGKSDLTVAGLSTVGLGGSIVGGNAATSALTVNQTTTTTFAGTIGGAGTNENNLSLTKSAAGTLVLSGTNTYTGATTISAGTLQLGSGGTTGTLSTSSAITNNGTLTINRSNAVLQGTDFSAAAITGSGVFTQAGTGTTTLTAANTYAGGTNINGGTLVIGADNTLATTGAVDMNSGGSGTTPATLDLSNFSQTLGSLAVRNGATTVGNADTITIGNGQALTVNGDVTIGRAAAASTTFATISGAGTFNVVNSGGTFQVGAVTGTTGHSTVTLDMSGLSTFTANLGSDGFFRIGNTSTSSTTTGLTMALAETSTITAGTVDIGGTTGNQGLHTLTLGGAENTINANTILLGASSGGSSGSRGKGEISFAPASTGTLKIRAANGTGRANLDVGSATAGQTTSNHVTGVFDTTGHDADLFLGVLAIGNRVLTANPGTATGATTGTFSFGSEDSKLDVETITMGKRMFHNGTAAVTAELNLSGGEVKIGAFGNLGESNNAAGSTSATVNISGGNVTIGTADAKAHINMAVSGNNGIITSLINITGGTVIQFGNITRNNVASRPNATATLTLDGGSLDMTGHNIGGAGEAALTNVNLRSGTLQNLGQLNNGGTLTKTTAGTLILGGTNAYTGATAVSEGTLLVNGTNTGTGGVTVNADATLGGTGSLASTVLVTANAILSPGASVESLASGALTMNSGSTFVYEATGNDATGADLMVVNGDLSLTDVTLDLSGADLAAGFWNPGDKLTLISYIGSGITSGFTDFTDDTGYQFGSNTWVINYNDTAKGANYNSEATGTSFVTLTVSAVPEPTTWVALALGGAGLCLLRRKRS